MVPAEGLHQHHPLPKVEKEEIYPLAFYESSIVTWRNV